MYIGFGTGYGEGVGEEGGSGDVSRKFADQNQTIVRSSVAVWPWPWPWPLAFETAQRELFCAVLCITVCTAQWHLEEASTHKSAKTHADNVFVTTLMTLTFDPQIYNDFPGLIVRHFSVEFGDPRFIGFWDIMQKQTDKQTNGCKNSTPGGWRRCG